MFIRPNIPTPKLSRGHASDGVEVKIFKAGVTQIFGVISRDCEYSWALGRECGLKGDGLALRPAHRVV